MDRLDWECFVSHWLWGNGKHMMLWDEPKVKALSLLCSPGSSCAQPFWQLWRRHSRSPSHMFRVKPLTWHKLWVCLFQQILLLFPGNFTIRLSVCGLFFFSSSVEEPYRGLERTRLLDLYRGVHCRIHSPTQPLKIIYHVSQREVLLAWVGAFVLFIK